MKRKRQPAAVRKAPAAKRRAHPRPQARAARRGARRKRAISASQARRIAARFDAAQRFAGASVRRAAKVPGYHPVAASADVWLVYPNSAEQRLGAAEVIAVCARTGRVLHAAMVGE